MRSIKRTNTNSTRWKLFNVIVILCSAIAVLFPDARKASTFVILFGGLLGPTYFIWLIYREKRWGVGGESLGEHYRNAKAGRQQKWDPLETAAMLAFVLALVTLIR